MQRIQSVSAVVVGAFREGLVVDTDDETTGARPRR
jgi:hypothetical protein